MEVKNSHYIHGTSEEEQARLSLMNRVMNPRCLAAIAPRQGERVLDVGSGLGQLTRAMQKAVGPQGYVLGIERDEVQMAKAQALALAEGEPLHQRKGNAFALPLQPHEWASFDLVHTRFLLEHLPDPLLAVRQMVAAARPGGRIFLQDDDHGLMTLFPEPPGFMPVWHAYLRTYDRLGNDPYIGRRLPMLLHQAGARPVRNGFVFFGGCHGEPDFGPLCLNTAELIRGAAEALVATGAVSHTDIERALQHFDEWSRQPGSAFWFPICFAEAVKEG